MRAVLLGLALVLAMPGLGVAKPDARSPAIEILERAISNEKDPKLLAQALADIDSLLAKDDKNAVAYYARGWVLSRIGKNDDAVAAYDRAYELDSRLADAAYNAGVVLGRTGNHKQAAIRFERALTSNPKHVDAAFNAGQTYYDLGEYARAAGRWEIAAALSPDDFQIAKKLVQAYVALGKADKIRSAREHVIDMWKAHRDPELAKLVSYVYDQFDVGKYHVYAYEAFETKRDQPIYELKVAADDKVVGIVTLEHDAAGYDVRVSKGRERATDPDHHWKRQPPYKTFKAAALAVIAVQFPR